MELIGKYHQIPYSVIYNRPVCCILIYIIPPTHFHMMEETSSVSHQHRQDPLRQMAGSSQDSKIQWWSGANIEPKSIYKCNLTVTLHKAWETQDIQPARHADKQIQPC